MHSQTTTADGGPVNIASALVGTLQQEHDALARLCLHFELQMDAMRQHQAERLEEATLSVAEEVGTLSRLQHTRDRQTRLLGRILNLGDQPAFSEFAVQLTHIGNDGLSQALTQAREQARNQALLAQERCKELEFALNYATDLGRDMLQALRGSGIGAPTLAYTPSGQAAARQEAQPLVNRKG